MHFKPSKVFTLRSILFETTFVEIQPYVWRFPRGAEIAFERCYRFV